MIAIAVPTATAVLVAAGYLWFERRAAAGPALDDAVAVQTQAVVRTDLSVTASLTGSLGYGGAVPVKGGPDGIVTWLPRSGAQIRRGEQVFRADDRPVPLFYGVMPLYRDLVTPGMVGRDVRIVAVNLRALGYPVGRQPGAGQTVTRTVPVPATAPSAAPGTKTERTTVRKGEGVLTSGLIAALKRWQQDRNLPVTGTIGPGDVVVLPGAVRVDAVTALKGDSAATPLMTVTSTAKVVTASVAVEVAGTIRAGDRVTVLLPGDTSVPGEVSAVGTEVQPGEDGGSAGEPKRTVTVTLDSTKQLNGIEAAQVQVELAGETREGVLAVPVGALVALSEGGYAVQVSGGGLVAVETGLFAKGLVEVTGAGIAEGVRVVTTS
ncbi:HlyD family efflux transporter periplasmic adaptor subunit [Actinoplanes couchii]|uniref:Peptidoglycan-binding protein n=1 Tax=Actinoplanes couchii TaxID=403638 RepID=A0ABQ3XR42_9ACTN|nr:HlyD family efflux transporter periplasmic adaptor subunit [Actinoplanes couchii]MDR6318174.1 peptidoglycan hydrolase-like protein with peptidoglycan-binding domain [Actinoplanes couchii]GID60968.1 peptidoglycan-binding protein [Actinoplanes couchii]